MVMVLSFHVPLLDPHAPQLPVKPGKSLQIVVNETTDPRMSDQATSTGGWLFSGPMRYDFCRVKGEGLAHVKLGQPNSIREPDAGV
jgi:hypothetical protein